MAEPKQVKCNSCNEIVKRKNAIKEVTEVYYCKDCYYGRKKK